MAITETAIPTFRIDPGLREASRAAAHQEHRSIAKMIEVLIRDYCEANGIAVPSPQNSENNNGEQSA